MVAGPETALGRWIVAGPETARLLTECEEKHSRKKKESERHHEQIPCVQKTFLAQTKNVTDVIEEHGNPFAEDTGKAQHQTFVAERLHSNIAAFNDTVHNNNLPLLTSKSGKKPTKSTSKICLIQLKKKDNILCIRLQVP